MGSACHADLFLELTVTVCPLHNPCRFSTSRAHAESPLYIGLALYRPWPGINLRGRQIPLHLQNPHNPSRYQPDTIRIKIKNIPLSADDGQIDRALAMDGCEIQGIFNFLYHEIGNSLVLGIDYCVHLYK
jgi:hypothetical protein